TFTASLSGSASASFTVTIADPADPPQAVIRGDNEAENNLTIHARTGEAIEVNGENSTGTKSVEWFWGDGDRTSGLLSAAHAYLYPATYPLKLRITNSGGLVSESTVSVIITDRPAATRTFTVTTMAALLAAYNQCMGGEDIIIPAGTVLTGSVELPSRPFSDYVTIRSSTAMPDMGVRVSPTQSGLATLRGSFATEIPMIIKNRASKIRLSGLKFDPFPNSNDTVRNYYMLQIGEAFGQTTTADNPNHIILDHCVISPPNGIQVVHGILNDGYKVSMIASYFGNIKTYGSQDSQAVFALDGRGAHVYNNTYFEAASESIIYGGAGNRIDGITPTNIEFRRCVFTKPVAWRQLPNDSVGESLNEKNLFESKNGRRIYVESSLFSNHWDAGRSQYFAIVVKSVPDVPGGDSGSPWSVTEDVVFENNRVSHVNGGMAITREFYPAGVSYDPLKPRNISFINMLFDDLTGGRWGTARTWVFYLHGVDDLSVRHISVIDAIETSNDEREMMLYMDSINSYRPEIVNSIIPLNAYGIHNTCGEGIATMNVGTSGWMDSSGNSCGAASGANAGKWVISGNVLPKMRTNQIADHYPTGNAYPENYDGIGMPGYRSCNVSFTADPCNTAISDFSLASSPYRNTAGDGTDPGISVSLLTDRLRCTASGDTR
ncbi:MAG TPA: hypothetical protein VHQ01_10770, partial [Pyrinomonadaceae bacterium]|nr:hypothetical protein [Pyrinomonadaceae bacterium]